MVLLNEIKAERIKAGLTQRQIAEKMFISPGSYNHKEQGNRPFSFEDVDAFGQALGLSKERLVEIFFA